jgi:hypothetical protein
MKMYNGNAMRRPEVSAKGRLKNCKKPANIPRKARETGLEKPVRKLWN